MSKKYYAVILLMIQIGVFGLVLYFEGNKEPINFKFMREELYCLDEGAEEPGFYFEADGGGNQQNISTPEVVLSKGIYRISGVYEMKGSGRVYANYTGNVYKDSINGIIDLDSRVNEFSFDLHIKEANRPVRIYLRLSSEAVKGDYLLIREIGIDSSALTVRYSGFMCVILLLSFNLILWCLYKRKSFGNLFDTLSNEQRFVSVGLVIIILMISLPATTGYVNQHFDTIFHLMRVEGIKDGLQDGQFPVRIQPGWMNNHGYAASIFYGELLLYFPALLRLCGLPLGLSYCIYIIVVNAATVLIAYYCFWKISDKLLIGFMASVFYSANIYRLSVLYERSAVGKYTAMIFYPLVIYGLWRLFTEETDRAGYKKIWEVLVIGYSGIIVSHTISTMMALGYTMLVCIIMWKKLLRKQTFYVLFKVFVLVVMINAWFLIPFIDYMRYDWIGNSYDPLEAPYRIMRRAEFIPQFFMTDYPVLGGEKNYVDGITGEMPFSIGISSALILTAGMMFKREKKDQKGKQRIVLYFLVGITMFATSTLFPWLYICKLFPVVSLAARVLQSPWRLNAVTVVLLSLLGCLVARKVEWNKSLQYGFIGLIIAISCIQGLDFESRVLRDGNVWFVDELGSGRFYQIGGEYLPAEANPNDYVYNITGRDEMVEVIDWYSQNNTVRVNVKNHGGVSRFEVPLLNYKGYQARDIAGNQILPITSGTSGRIRVEIPDGYEGTILVEFVPPWYWRVAEIVTLLTVCGWAGYEIIRRKRCGRLLKIA